MLQNLQFFSYDDEGRLVLRYLQGLGWKYDVTHQTINEHNDWCNKTMPFQMKSTEDFLTQGILYIYKRDRGHRPVMVINTERLIASNVISKWYILVI